MKRLATSETVYSHVPLPPDGRTLATTPPGYGMLVGLSALGLFLAWSLLPPLTMPNITLDAAEGLIWGRTFELGYAKHPPLQAWLLEGSRIVFGTGSFAHVWLSAACLVLAHIAVWRAARRFLDPMTAFWASAALQTIYFHNYAIPEFNPNVLQLPVFAFAGLFAIDALKQGRARDWLALGLVIGIGMYAKYSVALIAIAIAAFFIIDREGRKRLASPWPYAGAALAMLITAPHLVWMMESGGQTLGYVAARAQIAPGAIERAENVGELAANLLIGLPLALVLLLGRSRTRPAPDAVQRDGGRRLVYWLALGPLALTLLAVVLAGFRIKAAWLAPLWVWAPLAGFMLFNIRATGHSWRAGSAVIIAMAVLGLGAYVGNNLVRPYVSGKAMRVQFPGETLAKEVDSIWAANTNEPMRVVIGPTLKAGSVAHYSHFEPLVRVEDSDQANPWAPEALVDQAGAVILWDATSGGEALPPSIAHRRPEALYVKTLVLRQQTGANTPPARIGVALVPPLGGFHAPNRAKPPVIAPQDHTTRAWTRP